MREMKMQRNAFLAVLLVSTFAAVATAAPPARGGLAGTYDPQNVLAQTIRGEIPAERLYEDSHVLAFLADRPASLGHFIVVVKSSDAKNFLELSPRELSRIMAVAQSVARAEITAIGAQGFTLRQNNGSASSIMQYHLHIIPRWAGDKLLDGLQPLADPAALRITADKIRAELARR
jgi:histidine triad (HIT) family protein